MRLSFLYDREAAKAIARSVIDLGSPVRVQAAGCPPAAGALAGVTPEQLFVEPVPGRGWLPILWADVLCIEAQLSDDDRLPA